MIDTRLVLTFDVDWAPDFVIDSVADKLIQKRVKATWFVTHISPAITRLKEHPDLFELGMHPNFMPGSTHGKTEEEVLEHCQELVPDALSMRTHALIQSTPLFSKVLRLTSVRVDVSLFLPYAQELEPVWMRFGKSQLLRLPYSWSEGQEILQPNPDWELKTALSGSGMKIFNFHPIHIFLNSCNYSGYNKLKQNVRDLTKASSSDMSGLVNPDGGTGTAFLSLISYMARTGNHERICDIYADCKSEQL